MKLIKSDGRIVDFDESKIRQSVLRTGASKKVVEDVMSRVLPRVKNNMTTKEIYAIVYQELDKEDSCFSCRYNLRDALLRLGPAGYKFEKYVASILRAYKYEAYNPEEDLHGSCVNHEVDIVAEKDGRRMFIEAKFRNNFRDVVSLKDTMATWSRFLDLVDGAAVGKCPHFDECWIITNGHFSDRAQQFGTCKGIHMIGWNFPESSPFSKMVDNSTLYPITVIDHLRQNEIEALSRNNIMLCREVTEYEPEDLAQRLGGEEQRAEQLIEICSKIIKK